MPEMEVVLSSTKDTTGPEGTSKFSSFVNRVKSILPHRVQDNNERRQLLRGVAAGTFLGIAGTHIKEIEEALKGPQPEQPFTIFRTEGNKDVINRRQFNQTLIPNPNKADYRPGVDDRPERSRASVIELDGHLGIELDLNVLDLITQFKAGVDKITFASKPLLDDPNSPKIELTRSQVIKLINAERTDVPMQDQRLYIVIASQPINGTQFDNVLLLPHLGKNSGDFYPSMSFSVTNDVTQDSQGNYQENTYENTWLKFADLQN